MKYTPREIVNNNLNTASECSECTNLWWAHVTVAPDANKIAVFNSGILKGLKG